MEIERKFFLKTLPNLPVTDIYHIEQGYVSTDPEVRIRSTSRNSGITHHTLCIKGDGTLSREEIETGIGAEQFASLRILCGAPLIRKIHILYKLEEYILECSIVDPGEPHSFIYAEIEFSSEEEANAFQRPDFLVDEITNDSSLKMKNVWKRSRAIK